MCEFHINRSYSADGPQFWISATLVYNVFFHPLAGFPGPTLFAATRLTHVHAVISGRLPFVVQDLHERYGDVVRIAPDELSYNVGEAWKDIYGIRPGLPQHEKDGKFYTFDPSLPPSIIGADGPTHSRFRRLLAHAFSEKAMRQQDPTIKNYVDLLIQRLHENCKDGAVPLNMVSWYNWTTFDIIGDLAFGESFDCLANSDYHPWVKLIFDSLKAGAFQQVLNRYSFIKSLLRRFMQKSLFVKRKAHLDLVEQKVEKRVSETTDRIDFASCFLKPGDELQFQELVSNSSVLIIAGSETTATLLSGVTYHLLRSSASLKKLVDEVRGAFKSEDEINVTTVQRLKYMLAVLDEGFRMYPPVPIGLPRRTGPTGDTICGKWVPPNTTVSVNQWATNQSSKNFALPQLFIPERFLDDPRFASDDKSALQPFSVGPRNCLGRNLAYVEMRIILARVIWNFDMELAADSYNWTDQNVWTLWQKGELNVKLTPKKV